VIRTYKDQFSTGTGSYRLTGLSQAAIHVNGDQASAKLGYTIAPNGRGSVEFALTKAQQGWLISRIAASC
jgi:hypothetical protein